MRYTLTALMLVDVAPRAAVVLWIVNTCLLLFSMLRYATKPNFNLFEPI